MLLWIFIYVNVFFIPAWVWVLIWFLEQALMAALLAGQKGGGVAYFAHIGGFVAGVLLGGFVKYVLAPGRFRHAAPGPQPEEISSASRWGDGSRQAQEPFIWFEDDGPSASGATRFALIRMTDQLHDIGRIAATVSKITGEPGAAIGRRLDRSRGLIATDLPRAVAERAQRELQMQGIPAHIVPSGPGFGPPTPIEADRVVWDEHRMLVSFGATTHEVPWASPFLYLGAAVAREPHLDVLVTPRIAYRLTPRTRFDGGSLRDFALAVIEHRRGAAINDGVRVLAYRGSWGWLSFAGDEDFDNYTFWIFSLVTRCRR
jgi:hypothetical protein